MRIITEWYHIKLDGSNCGTYPELGIARQEAEALRDLYPEATITIEWIGSGNSRGGLIRIN